MKQILCKDRSKIHVFFLMKLIVKCTTPEEKSVAKFIIN